MKDWLFTMMRERGFWAVAATLMPLISYSAIGANVLYLPHAAMIMVVSLAVLALAGATWVSSTRDSFVWCRASLVAFWFIVFFSIPLVQWPLMFTVLLSQPALDRVAERVEHGEPLRLPVRAGFFIIQRAEMSDLGSAGLRPRVPCLWVEAYGTSFGRSALARSPEKGEPAYGSSNFDSSPLLGRWISVDED